MSLDELYGIPEPRPLQPHRTKLLVVHGPRFCGAAIFLKYTDGSWHKAGKKWSAPYLWVIIEELTTQEIKEVLIELGYSYHWV